MSTPWNSLYCPSEDSGAIIQSLRDSLVALGYESYDPFSAFPGKTYPQTIRLFVAPAREGWTRVIGAADEQQLPALSRLALCLSLSLGEGEAKIETYLDGERADSLIALTPYLRPGKTGDDLRHALFSDILRVSLSEAEANSSGLPFDALPVEVQALAGKVDKGAAEKMFSRLSGQLMKKVGGQGEAARALVAGDSAPDWNSPGGARLRALMACLTVRDNWREPDFVALRDAYPLHERHRRSPNARLYPGDESLMARVPDALAYTPVYGGRRS